MSENSQHVYVHVPFCDGKCFYCAFYSELHSDRQAARYLRALERELALHASRHGPIGARTLYVGGGTPTSLSAAQLRDLCALIHTHCDLAPLEEWTVEANPGSLSPEKLETLARSGVTRMSLGAQSFDDATLRRSGRRHDAAAIGAAVSMIRAAGIDPLGLDLIAALPGHTAANWEASLEQAVRLRPDHISVYLLSLDDGTPFAAAAKTGTLPLCDERVELERLDQASVYLSKAGYLRYEVSNYALPGRECRHNLSFWRGGDYLGFGPAAASRLGLTRHTNTGNLDGYCSALEHALPPPAAVEELDAATDQAERIAFALRLKEGIALSGYGLTAPQQAACATVLHELADHSVVICSGQRWRLTDKGTALADHVSGEIFAALTA